MGAEENKELVRTSWQALLGGKLEEALASFAEEATWLVPGNIPGASGVKKGKAAIREFISGIGQAFPEGLRTELRNVYADGDTVIVELTNRGKAANGRQYENEYCFVFELRGGKIRAIREYVDTQRVMDVLFAK